MHKEKKQTKIFVLGHGGYAKGIKENIEMIVGDVSNFVFADLTKNDDQNTFKTKVLNELGEYNILFSCDILGATPFRIAAELAYDNDDYLVVTGLNSMAYLELATNIEGSLDEICSRAMKTTKESLLRFPE